MRRRVTVKSNDLRLDLFNGQTSRPYNRMGRHLLLTRCKKRSSDADCPILLNNALTDLKNGCLAFSREHLNLQDLTSATPRYLIHYTINPLKWRVTVLSSHKVAAQLASWCWPTRIQQDFLTFTKRSSLFNSLLHIYTMLCSAVTDGAIIKMSSAYRPSIKE